MALGVASKVPRGSFGISTSVPINESSASTFPTPTLQSTRSRRHNRCGYWTMVPRLDAVAGGRHISVLITGPIHQGRGKRESIAREKDRHGKGVTDNTGYAIPEQPIMPSQNGETKPLAFSTIQDSSVLVGVSMYSYQPLIRLLPTIYTRLSGSLEVK